MKRPYATILVSCLTLALTACGDYFDRTGDGDTIADSRLFSDDAAFRSAMTDAYMQLRSEHLYGGTLTLTLLEQAAGTLTPYDAATDAAARHDFADTALRQPTDSMVRAAYSVVASCNKIIAEAGDTSTRSDEVRLAVGEAYGLRAAVQFDLLRLFHPLPSADDAFRGLPYITQLGQKDVQPLSTRELLRLIGADLQRADALLADTDPLRSATNPTTVSVGQSDRRLRTMQMNWYAVKAIEARVALWSGDYERIPALADSVFCHPREVAQRHQVFYYVQPGKYGSDFCFSREFVFGIATSPNGFPALCDRLFSQQGVRVAGDLHTVYPESSDIRYRSWFRQTTNGDYTMQRKFGLEALLTGYVVSSTGSETSLPASIPYIKIGEVALMAAEALCRQGHTAEALDWLEELEQTKDTDYAATLQASGQPTQADVLRLIEQEYERDLYGEGQLFYHRKRLSGDAAYVWPLPEKLLNIE